MNDKKSIQKLYHNQNITIRKNIREIDMGYDSFQSSNPQIVNHKKNDVHILVVGPTLSGKSTLLRTLHYALNGNLSCPVESKQISDTCYQKYEIKKNKKSIIEGLSKVKQTDQKLGVYGYQLNYTMVGMYKNPMDKYARAVQLLNNKTLGCIGHSISSTLATINYVIVCLNIAEKLLKDQAIALKFFIGELEEKRMKYSIVGTHIDQILGRDSINMEKVNGNNQIQEQKLIWIQQWKKFIQSQLGIKNTVEVYCMENYANICKKQAFQNSEMVNYYSLTLLEKCIKKAPDSQKAKKLNSKFFCF